MGQEQTVNVGNSGGGLGCAALLAIVVIGAVIVAGLLATAANLGAVATVKQADTAAIQADAARLVAQAQADAVRIRAQAEAARSAQEGAALADGLRAGLPILAWLLGVAILAAVVYLVLRTWTRATERGYRVLPPARADAPMLPSGGHVVALPMPRRRLPVARSARRVVVGDLQSRGETQHM